MLTFGLVLFAFTDFLKDKLNLKTSSTNNFQSVLSGTTESGDVAIEITPQNIDNGKISFLISANTHSVDLSQFDLKKITFLEYDGNSITPIETPLLEGHHTSGLIVFNIEDNINSFKIKIKGIPKIEERIFSWD